MRFNYIFLIIISLFLFTSAFALDFVKPGTFDNVNLALYPGLNTTIDFLKVESGTQVFVDNIQCSGVYCGVLKTVGPYYSFDVQPKEKNANIKINYHLKGQEESKVSSFSVIADDERLSAMVFLSSEVKFFNKTEVKVLLVNNTDMKLSGQLKTNFPDDVFTSVNFIIDPKSKAEYTTYFYPKNAGYFDITYLLNVDGVDKEREVGKHTVKVNRDLVDFLSLPTKSYLPINPVESLYASIVYFVSLLA